jgi:N-acyl-L-homoserine lactone synthetase
LRVKQVDLSDHAQRDGYIAFRTDYFGRQLGWKVIGASGIDFNDVDRVSAHYALCRTTGEIVGGIRITPPSTPWMIDEAPFSEIIDPARDPRYPRHASAEIARLGVHRQFADAVDEAGYTAGQALRRAAYQHSVAMGIRYWYVVAYRALIARLRRFDHLPFRTISSVVHFDQAKGTCVACLDLAAAHARMRQAAPEFYAWNNAGLAPAQFAYLATPDAKCL